MRFLMLIYPDRPQTHDGWVPNADAPGAAMGGYNKGLGEAGVLLGLDGLLGPDRGARIRFNGPVPTVKDGPFTEAKEIVGGFWIIDCSSKDEAGERAALRPLHPLVLGGAVDYPEPAPDPLGLGERTVLSGGPRAVEGDTRTAARRRTA